MIEAKIDELISAISELTQTIRSYQVPAASTPAKAAVAAVKAVTAETLAAPDKAPAKTPAKDKAPAKAKTKAPVLQDNDFGDIDDGFGDESATAVPEITYTGANAGDALKALRDVVAKSTNLDKGRAVARTVLSDAGIANIVAIKDSQAASVIDTARQLAENNGVLNEWLDECEATYKVSIA